MRCPNLLGKKKSHVGVVDSKLEKLYHVHALTSTCTWSQNKIKANKCVTHAKNREKKL